MWRLPYNLVLVVAFFATFKVCGIYVATYVVIAGVVVEICVTVALHRRVTHAQWIGLFLVLALGGSTLLFRNEIFIKWRPTGVYWMGAVGLLISATVFGTNPIRAAASKWVDLPERLWHITQWTWTGLFTILGALNLFVAYRFSTDTWVTYRIFVAPCLIVLLAAFQLLAIRGHVASVFTRLRNTTMTTPGPDDRDSRTPELTDSERQ